jgi:uncharacterized cysteine cluster protein YcgN (CxxCxxCC family)
MNNNTTTATTCKTCGSCGMPLVNASDYALGDITQVYCTYCTDEQGHLKPYNTILQGMTDYIIHSQGINNKAALTIAEETLKRLPAWKSKNILEIAHDYESC